MSVNRVILLGRLGTDPELKYTPSGAPVANFSLATSDVWTDKDGKKQEKTEWHRIVVWGKLAELCHQYLAKGRQAFVEGKLQTRSWDDQASGQKRYMTEINAQSVQFIGARQEGQPGQAGQTGYSQDSSGSSSDMNGSFSQDKHPHQHQQQQQQPMNAFQPVSDLQFTSEDIPF